MPIAILLALTAVLLACGARQAAPAPQHPAPLVLEVSIDLPGVEGRIDHLAADLARERLFVAALGNDSVEVVDLKGARHMRSLRCPGEPQGILYLADSDRVVVSSGEEGTCEVYDGATLERVASLDLGDDADNLRYDPAAKRLYAGYGDGALGIVDAQTWKPIASVRLEGHPESFQLDLEAKRAYVNVPDAHQIAVVDLEAHTVVATWRVDEAQANFPMALLPAAGAPDAGPRLLVGCRSPAKLVLRSLPGGKPQGVLALSGDTDDIFYDEARRRVYAACGAGSVDVFARDAQGALQPLAQVATAAGARTALFVPERGLLFVAVPHREGQRAEVRVFRAEG
jgi:hypothetical protein